MKLVCIYHPSNIDVFKKSFTLNQIEYLGIYQIKEGDTRWNDLSSLFITIQTHDNRYIDCPKACFITLDRFREKQIDSIIHEV